MSEPLETPAWPVPRWYVVSTKPRKEDLARALMEHAGLQVFAPRVLEWSPSRRRVQERVTSMFPGYLFVRMLAGRDYCRVRWMPGVKRVIGCGDGPEAVADGLVEELAERMGSRGYVAQGPRLSPGDQVEVRHGPFAGLMGIVEGPSASAERVRVLLAVFSRRTSVEIDGRHLVRLGHGC